MTYPLAAAQAAKATVQLALESEVNGVNTKVAQISAQLDNARWELDQTTVRAPSNGIVTSLALSVGARVLTARSAMSFIVSDDVMLIGMFFPNGFETIKPDPDGKIVSA